MAYVSLYGLGRLTWIYTFRNWYKPPFHKSKLIYTEHNIISSIPWLEYFKFLFFLCGSRSTILVQPRHYIMKSSYSLYVTPTILLDTKVNPIFSIILLD